MFLCYWMLTTVIVTTACALTLLERDILSPPLHSSFILDGLQLQANKAKDLGVHIM